MIYLDYSASTPVDKKVLKRFNDICLLALGNANSIHQLGNHCEDLVLASEVTILDLLNLPKDLFEVVFTSGASEANNLAIKGLAGAYPERKHIIMTSFEHSTVIAPVAFLQKQGYEVDLIHLQKNGLIDVDELVSKIRSDTLLVTVLAVNSELGIHQPIEEIAKIVRHYPGVYFHSDATQSIGKAKYDFSNLDLISCSGHKIYGIKGVGALIKRRDIRLEPQISGGSTHNPFRSGTPAHPLVDSFAYALKLMVEGYDKHHAKVLRLNRYLHQAIDSLPHVVVNSNELSIPQIINISVLGKPSIETMHYLERKGIFISTYTACSSKLSQSKSVLALTGDVARAQTSIRISLSHLTTYAEVDALIAALKEWTK